MENSRTFWFFAGIGSLLFAKYVLFGLDRWNGVLHPGRKEPAGMPKFFLKGIL